MTAHARATTLRADEIRAWMAKGFDTTSMARLLECVESDLWNALGTTELTVSAADSHRVADRLAHGRAVSIPPKTSAGASQARDPGGLLGAGVISRLGDAELQPRDLRSGKDAHMRPGLVTHHKTSPGASEPRLIVTHGSALGS